MELSSIDLTDPELWGTDRQHEALAALRRSAPVWRHPDPNGPGPWVLTRHADITEVSRNWEAFSSDRDTGGIGEFLKAGRDAQQAALSNPAFGQMFIEMDPPKHGSYRKVTLPSFTAKATAALENHIREVVTRLVDNAIEQGEVDFVRELAVELPLQVVADLIGVPKEDRQWLFSHVMRKDASSEVRAEQMKESYQLVREYGRQMIDARTRERHDDIVGRFAEVEIEGAPVSISDQQAQFTMFWAAGVETTRTTMSSAMHAFVTNPDAYRMIVEDPSLLATTAMDEILRWASPVPFFRRNVTVDTELRGQPIKAGDTVALFYVSGNRDEEVFDDPFKFDVLRSPNQHLAFGARGPHYCLGASVAKMQVRALFEEIANRVPELTFAGVPHRIHQPLVHSIGVLPVSFASAKRS